MPVLKPSGTEPDSSQNFNFDKYFGTPSADLTKLCVRFPTKQSKRRKAVEPSAVEGEAIEEDAYEDTADYDSDDEADSVYELTEEEIDAMDWDMYQLYQESLIDSFHEVMEELPPDPTPRSLCGFLTTLRPIAPREVPDGATCSFCLEKLPNSKERAVELACGCFTGKTCLLRHVCLTRGRTDSFSCNHPTCGQLLFDERQETPMLFLSIAEPLSPLWWHDDEYAYDMSLERLEDFLEDVDASLYYMLYTWREAWNYELLSYGTNQVDACALVEAFIERMQFFLRKFNEESVGFSPAVELEVWFQDGLKSIIREVVDPLGEKFGSGFTENTDFEGIEGFAPFLVLWSRMITNRLQVLAPTYDGFPLITEDAGAGV